ncbi:chorismate mutase [Scenedesmus sp. NREL 46B-D3]|nr:chorismate mutase [Scenedesmus sp. NREL 46B-D3]
MSASLTLPNIRSSLIRQEDSIIFTLIERAQFAQNPLVYQPGGVEVPAYGKDGKQFSLMEYILRETEQLHGKELPAMVLPPLEYPSILAPGAAAININSQIMQIYLNSLLPAIAAPGDDGNYGSAATLDVLTLQALSKRIHYGKFVAEAKFRAKPEEYTALIKAQDADSLMDLLTDRKVELAVVERVRLKAATFGQDVNPAMQQAQQQQQQQQQQHEQVYKIEPDVLAKMYDDVVMPLTKDVQVAYLLRRLDDE